MWLIYRTFVILLVFFLGACASTTGNKHIAKVENRQMLDKIFVPGNTTKKDVRLILGEPNDIDFDNNGNEKWFYEHVKKKQKAGNFIPIINSFVSGTNDVSRRLVILFDEDDLLKKFAFSKRSSETKTGMSSDQDRMHRRFTR